MKHKVLLFALFLAASSLSAATLPFPEANFSLEVPSDWVAVTPKPAQVTLVMKNPIGSKVLIVLAIKSSGRHLLKGAADMREGAQQEQSKAGWKIFPEQRAIIAGIPFIFYHSINGNQASTFYTTSAGDYVYGIRCTKVDGMPFDDAELNSVINSFKLLSPARMNPLTQSSGARVGKAIRIFTTVAFIPSLLLIAWLFYYNRSRRKKNECPPAILSL
ncbi:MAG: hypothetical protein ACH346_07775 [Chthoniobacterales bacterium]